MMDLSSYRDLFPVTESAIYLNHAAISPYSSRVSVALSKQISARSSGSIDLYPVFLEERQKLKENYARLINGRPADIALIPNTSTGLNWLANGLRWNAGDRILLVAGEFPSNVYPFLNLKRRGVEIDFADPSEGMIGIDDLAARIDKRTKILSVSYVQFLNGYRIDPEDIGRLCRSRNIIFSVDGIQGVGAVPLDVRAAGIDFLANGGHKWLMGPMGCGFMYIKPELHERLEPAFAGWLSVKNSWDFLDYRLDFLDDAERYELGTANFLGIAGARAASDLLVEVGPARIERHLLELGNYLIEAMETSGFVYTGSRDEKHRAGICSFRHERAKEIFDHLTDNKIIVSLREGVIRISPHFYNTRAELENLVRTIGKIL